MSAEEHKAFVRRYIEDVWNRGDVAAVRDDVAPDVVLHGLAPEPMRGLAAVERSLAALRAAFPDLAVAREARPSLRPEGPPFTPPLRAVCG